MADLHKRIVKAQQVEALNSSVESVVRGLEAELEAKREELKRSELEAAELVSVPCGGQGPYADCVKIRRAIESRNGLPELEGSIATLALEVDVQRTSLKALPKSSAELTTDLERCEGERRDLQQRRSRYEELRRVDARRAERMIARERLNRTKVDLEAKSTEWQRNLAWFP